jgi:hypothetical protein
MKMIAADHHHQCNHQGVETVVNKMRQKYHVSSLQSQVKNVFNNCQMCQNRKANPKMPVMGTIPDCKLQPTTYPLRKTGVDYFGPMGIAVKRTREKRYGVLFAGLSTRAVNLELAGSLSTDSWIVAIRRFISRRGNPLEMHSDNGTNFKRAATELKKAIGEYDQ